MWKIRADTCWGRERKIRMGARDPWDVPATERTTGQVPESLKRRHWGEKAPREGNGGVGNLLSDAYQLL